MRAVRNRLSPARARAALTRNRATGQRKAPGQQAHLHRRVDRRADIHIPQRAAKLQKRAARHGAALQGADAAALADAAENLQTAQPASAQAEQAVGELLFAAANLARQAGVDPEQALQKANEAFCTAAGPVA